MSPEAKAKLVRKLDALNKKIWEIIDSPKDDPIWADDEFWNVRWLKLLEQRYELEDQIYGTKETS
jgi:hypothetical protein